MASIFLLGSKPKAFEYLDGYVGKNKIADYNIEKLEGVKVEDIRGIKKKLSYKSATDRLFFFFGEITIEAQNALLKSVEEHSPTTHFIFAAEKEDNLLPTIRSRCFTVRLEKEAAGSEEIERLIALFYSKDSCDWDVLDKIISKMSDNEPEVLIPAVRKNIVSNLDDTKNIIHLYTTCKKMLSLLPLVNKNNVSARTFVEKSFVSDAIR